MQQEIPAFLFQLPGKETAQEQLLRDFLDSHKDQCIPYFPWLTGEIMDHGGGDVVIDIIRDYGSTRLPSSRLCELLTASERLISVLDVNGGDDGTLEVQSVSGFITCIRRYSVDLLVKTNIDRQHIIQLTGISGRTLQRIKSPESMS